MECEGTTGDHEVDGQLLSKPEVFGFTRGRCVSDGRHSILSTNAFPQWPRDTSTGCRRSTRVSSGPALPHAMTGPSMRLQQQLKSLTRRSRVSSDTSAVNLGWKMRNGRCSDDHEVQDYCTTRARKDHFLILQPSTRANVTPLPAKQATLCCPIPNAAPHS